ncbi:heme peroxidase [Aureobasidium subglaciale]|nr:heme peroxidase [Aureobasidium subglaciale]
MISNLASLLLVSSLGLVDAFSMPEAASSFTSLLASSLNDAIPNTLAARKAGSSGSGGGGSGGCPAIWTTISSDLTASFLGSDGQCTDLARAAIRFAFHDAGPYSSKTTFYAPAAGGADGSLLLNPDEINRPENGGLGDYYNWLTNKYNTYNQQAKVGAADLIQFAGSHAVITCPGGPKVKTVVGRTDSSTIAPDGFLPAGFGPNSSHDVLFQLFLDKGFSARDLAALIGAHSTSKAFTQQANGIPVGGPQDSTPGKWDIDFYAQTLKQQTGVYRFQADINLSNASTTVGKEFKGFVGNQGKWTSSFADAMQRLSVLGIPSSAQNSFIDCTNALPKGTSSKRDIRAAPINNRAR